MLVGGVLNALRNFQCLSEVPILKVTLGKIELVLGDIGVVLGQLLIDSCGVEEILTHEVAIGKKRHGSTSGTELKLVVKMVDGLSNFILTSWYLPYLMRV